MNESSKLKNYLKKHNLPTRAIVSNFSKEELRKMSDKELNELFNKERAKISILKEKSRSLRSDMNKKFDNLLKQKEQTESDWVNIQYVPQTKTNLKKAIAIKDRMKAIAEKITKVKNETLEEISYLNEKADTINALLSNIEEILIQRAKNRRTTNTKAPEIEVENTPHSELNKEIIADHITRPQLKTRPEIAYYTTLDENNAKRSQK